MYIHMYMCVQMWTPPHRTSIRTFALGNFHRILHLFPPFLTNAGGIAAKGDELHFVKTQKLSFLQMLKSAFM